MPVKIPEAAGEPYQPSNGTEGMIFEAKWCERCRKDAAYRETMDGDDGCGILAATMAFGVDDPGYPKEWVYDSEGVPKCTAFDPIGDHGSSSTEREAMEAAGQTRLV